jgi:hypothetical protein
LYTDRGAPFRNALMEDLSRLLHFKTLFTSANHPQAHGKVERLVGSVKTILRTVLKDYEQHWVDALQPSVFAYNTGVNATTGYTPFYLVHGREAEQPGDSLSASIDEDAGPRIAYAQDLATYLADAHGYVKQLLESQRQAVDAKNEALPRTTAFREGDKVYLREVTHDARTGGHGAALKPFFAGPYVVLRRLGDVNYEVQALNKTGERTGAKSIVHAQRLRSHGPERDSEAPKTDTVDVEASAVATPSSDGPSAVAEPAPVPMEDVDTPAEEEKHSPPSGPAGAAHARHQQLPVAVYSDAFLPTEPIAQKHLSLPHRAMHDQPPPRRSSRRR